MAHQLPEKERGMISRLLLGALLATCLTNWGAIVARGQTETSLAP
jgi:hypothetical protein